MFTVPDFNLSGVQNPTVLVFIHVFWFFLPCFDYYIPTMGFSQYTYLITYKSTLKTLVTLLRILHALAQACTAKWLFESHLHKQLEFLFANFGAHFQGVFHTNLFCQVQVACC
jgi:hypothetical protein